MAPLVLLLRAVNVGGSAKLPMAELRGLLGALGARDVATYIQSGNAVFSGDGAPDDMARQIEQAIETRFGFRRDALVLPGAAMAQTLAACPFTPTHPKFLHFWFLSRPADPDQDAMKTLAANGEDFTFLPHAFCLHAPAGIGRSKLATRAERLLGVPTTARNANTVAKLADMVAALA